MSDEDLRSRFRRNFESEPEKPVSPRVNRQPTHSPTPAPAVVASQPMNRPTPAVSSQPKPQPVAPAQKPQAAPVHRFSPSAKPQRPKKSYKKAALLTVIALIVLGAASGGGFVFYRSKHTQNDKKDVLGQATQVEAIPLYYPKNLPTGYTDNNDSLALKTNVFYSSVTDPKGQKFFITQQPIPSSFDFVAFSKKFANADNFDADAGSATTGQVGSGVIASIKTNKNTWILVNAPNSSNINGAEVVVRSLEQR